MVENKNGTTVSPGERIQQLCDTHQLTRKELALHLGVAPSQISRILNGDTKSINSDLLIKLAREFHVSTDYILGLHKEPQDTGYLPMLLMSTAFRPGESEFYPKPEKSGHAENGLLRVLLFHWRT